MSRIRTAGPLGLLLVLQICLNQLSPVQTATTTTRTTSSLVQNPVHQSNTKGHPEIGSSSGVTTESADQATNRRIAGNSQYPQKSKPPASPVNLFMPDEFQFYTLNQNGELVMKQMTKQEIQGMLAAGGSAGSGVPDVTVQGIQDSAGQQSSEANHQADMTKVSDVVQNVQNVIQSELNKPSPTKHITATSIPGSVNSEWVNMLPHVLSGALATDQDSILLPPSEDLETDVVNAIHMTHKQNQPAITPRPATTTHNYVKLKPSYTKKPPVPTKFQSQSQPTEAADLLGNMAIDEHFLEGTHTRPAIYNRPATSRLPPPQGASYTTFGYTRRPTTTSDLANHQASKSTMKPSGSIFEKFSTTQSRHTTRTPQVGEKPKNSTKVNEKPTLYIPLAAVSSSLMSDLMDSEHKTIAEDDKYTKPTTPQHYYPSTASLGPSRRPSYPEETEYSSVPMIQIPVLSADEINTSTQRIGDEKTPMFEMLPTISPGLKHTQYLVTERGSPSPPAFDLTSTTKAASELIELLTRHNLTELRDKLVTEAHLSSSTIKESFDKISTILQTSSRLPSEVVSRHSATQRPATEPMKLENQERRTTASMSSSTTPRPSHYPSTTFGAEVEVPTTIIYDNLIKKATTEADKVHQFGVDKPKLPVVIAMGITNPQEFNTQFSTELPQDTEAQEEDTTNRFVPLEPAEIEDKNYEKLEYTIDSENDTKSEQNEKTETVSIMTSPQPQLEDDIESFTTVYEKIIADLKNENNNIVKFNEALQPVEVTTTTPFEKLVTFDADNYTKTNVNPETPTRKYATAAPTTKAPVNVVYQGVPDEDTSTVKVIPIYDDAILIHTPDGSSAYVQTPHAEKPKETSTSTTTTTTQVPSTDLPGLVETFNNYMKEHYEVEVTSTERSEEVPKLTTFSEVMSPAKDDGLVLNREGIDAMTTVEVDDESQTHTTPSVLEDLTGDTVENDAVTTESIILLKTEADQVITATEEPQTESQKMTLATESPTLIANVSDSERNRVSMSSSSFSTTTAATTPSVQPNPTQETTSATSNTRTNVENKKSTETVERIPNTSSTTPSSVEYSSLNSTREKLKTSTAEPEITPGTINIENFTQIPLLSLPLLKKDYEVEKSPEKITTPLEKVSAESNKLENSLAGSQITPTVSSQSKTDPSLKTKIITETPTSAKKNETINKPIVNSSSTFMPTTALPRVTSPVQHTVTNDSKTDEVTISQNEKQVSTTTEKIQIIPNLHKFGQNYLNKSAGRINLEEEKLKKQPTKLDFIKPSQKNITNTKETINLPKPNRPSPTSTSFVNNKVSDEKDPPRKWTLIPQQNATEQIPLEMKEKLVEPVPTIVPETTTSKTNPDNNQPIVTLDHQNSAVGLDQSIDGVDKDIAAFLNLCNELSFKFWTSANIGLSPARSVTLSPFGMISTLSMIFLGARGQTSEHMNTVLKLDDVITFNPHLVFQNITDSVTLGRGQNKIENAAFVRALFADRLKVRRIMPFYKEQAQQFYEGAVVDINFSTAGDILRRRTNLLIRKQTGGRIKDFVKSNVVPLRSPLTALSANIFQTSCNSAEATTEGRDGEMYFAVSQTVKQRKLVPIPAVVWKSGVSAGYEPSLDATAIALGDPKKPVSFIMLMPGQNGLTAPGDNLERLETRLFRGSDGTWDKLLKVIIPRPLEIQIPKFSHRSIVNVTGALKKMGFEHLFTRNADLKGINGFGHDLYLADMIQMNLFSTCADDNHSGSRHLTETYPGTSSRHVRNRELANDIDSRVMYDESNSGSNRRYNRDFGDWSETEDSFDDNGEQKSSSTTAKKDWNLDKINNLKAKLYQRRLMNPLHRQRRQTEFSEKPRIKMDKPFIYFVRHNPTGLILHIGRFNPKHQS